MVNEIRQIERKRVLQGILIVFYGLNFEKERGR